MKTLTANKSASGEELISLLKNGLSKDYDYELIGNGEDKYILVRKNAFVGAKILNVANKISIEAIVPSTSAYLFVFAVTMWTGLFMGWPQPWVNFEKSIGKVLVQALQ